ncbi:hypothetical protein E2562_029786 [Oryza meyeriana var. granulata]|uniref:No apical meristem-associated C-terminal domain-containing protein n=1 Tax=Oryza meyeriana var. granulata TaxID=110450 RepID=A0A6G1E447_9ORYZ|nr:hypothetical protein E2562_029786 [Oryza meyeriana var. granulata]
MDLTRAGCFTCFLEDLDAMPMFSHPLSQPASFSVFPFAHAAFPSFCTQPPPVLPTRAPATATDARISKSRNRHRVATTPEVVDDGREAFNATTPEGRKREMHHLKGHWHKTTKKVSFFNGCYIQLRDTYASGRSDGQLMDQAMELYRTRQGHQFAFVHWWKAVANSPKWNVHISSGGAVPKKHTLDLNMNSEAMERPMGIKRAKKGKGNADEVAVEVKEHLKALVDAQSTQKEEMEGVKEFQ